LLTPTKRQGRAVYAQQQLSWFSKAIAPSNKNSTYLPRFKNSPVKNLLTAKLNTLNLFIQDALVIAVLVVAVALMTAVAVTAGLITGHKDRVLALKKQQKQCRFLNN
jgi:hypothetical protein